MLGLLGLRIGEACSADVQDMGTQRGLDSDHLDRSEGVQERQQLPVARWGGREGLGLEHPAQGIAGDATWMSA